MEYLTWLLRGKTTNSALIPSNDYEYLTLVGEYNNDDSLYILEYLTRARERNVLAVVTNIWFALGNEPKIPHV